MSINIDYDTEGLLHQLGYGGYGTLWLVYDDKRRHGSYVALKVTCAEYSDEYELSEVLKLLRKYEKDHGFPGRFLLELERVFHTSPNGRHLCQVFPVLRPSLSAIAGPSHRLYPSYIKGFARELAEAVNIMHSMGICHGEDSPHWPEFAYLNADLGPLPPDYLSTRLSILDFDQAFLASDPPKDVSNIPLPYLAPDSIFTRTNGPAADVWALGSILFNLRAPLSLFEPFMFPTVEGTGVEMCKVLGLPQKEWYKLPFLDGFPIHGPLQPNMEYYYTLQTMYDNFDDDGSKERNLEYWVKRIKEPRRPASRSSPTIAIQQFCLSVPNFNAMNDQEKEKYVASHMTPIRNEDADLFIDLLRKIFTYDHRKRVTAKQILEHPWPRDSDPGSDVTNTQSSAIGESGKDAAREEAASQQENKNKKNQQAPQSNRSNNKGENKKAAAKEQRVR
ncbi:hypothetical protein VTG60DRAFT_3851 [Thermothelomyces hinnuleus]